MRKKKGIAKFSSSQKRRFKTAEKEFRKMWEEVKPFVKKRTIREYSTTGEWKTSP